MESNGNFLYGPDGNPVVEIKKSIDEAEFHFMTEEGITVYPAKKEWCGKPPRKKKKWLKKMGFFQCHWAYFYNGKPQYEFYQVGRYRKIIQDANGGIIIK